MDAFTLPDLCGILSDGPCAFFFATSHPFLAYCFRALFVFSPVFFKRQERDLAVPPSPGKPGRRALRPVPRAVIDDHQFPPPALQRHVGLDMPDRLGNPPFFVVRGNDHGKRAGTHECDGAGGSAKGDGRGAIKIAAGDGRGVAAGC